MNKALLSIILSVFLLFACKKEHIIPDNPYGLPNATQDGRDMFACRVNGENWIGGDLRGYDFYTDVSFSESFVRIQGTNLERPELRRFTIYIDTQFLVTNKEIPLDDTLSRFVNFYAIGNPCIEQNRGYGSQLIKNMNGGITISRNDTVKNILCGTFWFNFKTDNCDTIKVTDGRFDIRYF